MLRVIELLIFRDSTTVILVSIPSSSVPLYYAAFRPTCMWLPQVEAAEAE